MSLTADASGNFYTTQPVSWGDELYTDVRGSGAGTLRAMEGRVTGGACSSCHRVGDRIRAD